jgi:DNA-binding PadR family transcriptional regulator
MSDPTLLVLASLAEGDKHGYAIQQDILGFAGQRLGPETLYGSCIGALVSTLALAW